MDILLDHAVGVGVDQVDLVLIDAFSHAATSSDARAGLLIVVLFGTHTGEDSCLHCGVLFVEGVVFGHALEGRRLALVGQVARCFFFEDELHKSIFEFALELEAGVCVELCLVNDFLEKRGGFFVVVGATDELADLGQVQAFGGGLF